MKTGLIKYVFVLLVFTNAFPLQAQQTLIYDDPVKIYNDALQLYAQENFGAADPLFQRFKKLTGDANSLFYEDADYYIVICKIRLDEKDASKYVNNFIHDYPESARLPGIYFELGNLYFNKRRYRQALQAFNKSSVRQLAPEQRSAYYYKRGYSLLQLDKPDAALESFSKVASSDKTYAKAALFYTAHIHYGQKDYQLALSEFQELEDERRFQKYIPGYLINIYYELGNYDKVVEIGTNYIDKAGRRSRDEIAGLIANAYYNLGDYTAALAYFEIYEFSSRKPIDPEEHYRIGYTRFVNEKYSAAIQNFQEATKASPELAQNAWYHLGYCYVSTGELKFAQNAFFKAYQNGRSKELATDALFNYVLITLDIGSDMYNDPVETMEAFIRDNPDLPRMDEAYDLLAQLYLTSKNYGSALSSIEKTRTPNTKLQGIYQQIAYTQAIDYFNKGEYENALNLLDKSLFYTPDKELYARTLYWYGDALYRLKRYPQSESRFREFLNVRQARQTGLYGNGTYNLAYTYFNQRDYTNAVKYFKNFIQLEGQDPGLQNDAMLRLADSYFITKDYTNAMTWYNRVIRNDSRDIDYAIYQKAFCYGAAGDFNDKIRTLQVLVREHNRSQLYDDALFEIASTSLILNDPRGAITYFDKLVRERPNSPFAKRAMVKMGFVYYNNNQYDRAIQTMKRVINQYPASLEAKEALNTLRNIYMDQGRLEEYFVYAKSLDFVQISTSEEDSLTFVSGENYFIDNDCNNAIIAFKNYLDQFPEGGFVLSANNYLATCYERQGNLREAIEYYSAIIEFPDNQFTDKALLKTARYAFDNDDYRRAFQLYARLNEIANDPGMILESRDGATRSAYQLGDNEQTLDYANQLLEMPNASENQIVFARYVSGGIYLADNNFQEAENQFSMVDEMTTGEMGAEAKYRLASINFSRGEYDRSEELIYQLSEQYPGYDYWIASGFILLADIYLQRDNAFQAEQTLISVIENYPGEDLRSVARDKLNKIKPPEEKDEGTE